MTCATLVENFPPRTATFSLFEILVDNFLSSDIVRTSSNEKERELFNIVTRYGPRNQLSAQRGLLSVYDEISFYIIATKVVRESATYRTEFLHIHLFLYHYALCKSYYENSLQATILKQLSIAGDYFNRGR